MHTHAIPDRPAPSPLRIGALSTALSLNLLGLLGLTLMQASMPLPTKPAEPPPMVIDMVPRPVQEPTPLPPMPVVPVRPKPVPTPRTLPTPVPVAPVPVAESAWSEPMSVPASDTALDSGSVEPAPSGGGQSNVLEYVAAPPPPYPPLARRRGMTGEVLLRVRVGTDGLPVEVIIESSSGHTMLDRQAQSHVLKKWRFAPATVDGRVVEAWGLVPIRFALQ